ncbi:MAG TPA: Crp/Fnr family transcriptional regulator [Pyrinomonadaceae bacterium]|jgi:CRP-like cAMP-binding protein|nr:Crp/Fnr family transcriptional regulator [Pyrinomonadaceae bacterium]
MSALSTNSPPNANRILNQLPPEEYERLSPYLEPVTLSRGDVLYYPQDPVSHVYFPNSGTVSVVATFVDGGGVEVGVVGNEGVFGVNVVLGSVTTPHEAMVQLPGDGVRTSSDVLRREFERGGQLHDLLLRYTQAFIVQIAQTAACNKVHPLDGRLARWLLMSSDRAMGNELELTHDFMAVMLGTRRAGVTEAAGRLQDTGLIRYRRGRITVLDRPGLEATSCECYPVVKKEFDRLLGVKE